MGRGLYMIYSEKLGVELLSNFVYDPSGGVLLSSNSINKFYPFHHLPGRELHLIFSIHLEP